MNEEDDFDKFQAVISKANAAAQKDVDRGVSTSAVRFMSTMMLNMLWISQLDLFVFAAITAVAKAGDIPGLDPKEKDKMDRFSTDLSKMVADFYRRENSK